MIMSQYTTYENVPDVVKYPLSIFRLEEIIIRKVMLTMNEQKKYEVIKSLADHPDGNKDRA
ncbi:MAG: hypothetical protein J6C19_15375, partial [Lachnospiraceae bacterium]|nr:hypothetical protein [Lachnospiraceae bacterium]